MVKGNGFTLIELLAVIIIITLLCMFLIPNVLKYYNSTKSNLTSIQKQQLVDAAKLYYQDCMYDEVKGVDACSEFDITKLTENDTNHTYTYCVTLEKLFDLEYTDKIYVDKKLYSADIEIVGSSIKDKKGNLTNKSDTTFNIKDNLDFDSNEYAQPIRTCGEINE